MQNKLRSMRGTKLTLHTKARPDNSCHARGPHTGVEPSRRMHGAVELLSSLRPRR